MQIHPESAILVAHSHLREERPLGKKDLDAFTPFVRVDAKGPIARDQLSSEDEALRARLTPALHPQLERIRAQQFLSFGVLRRDVRYEMCGETGHVVLSGAGLTGATTPEAVRPIRRRLILWGVAAFVLCLCARSYHLFLSGASAYFEPTNRTVALVLAIGVIGALVAAGGALRALRPGFGWWPIGRLERAASGAFVGAMLLGPLVAYLGRPRPAEVHAAVVAGDLERARVVVDALIATRPPSEVADVANELELAEAAKLSGEVRLTKLDVIAERGGARAPEARDQARRQRLDAVREALAAGRIGDAIALLDRWMAALAGSEDAAEVRASAFDAKGATCTDASCRLYAARSAKAAHASPARDAAFTLAREQLVQALAVRSAAEGDTTVRVRALRDVTSLARATQLSERDDADLAEKAGAASTWAATELGKVVLLGAPAAAVEMILERPENAGARSGLSGWPELHGVAVHVAQVSGRCVGLYVVGATEGGRALSGKEAGLNRLLAQATGRTGASVHERGSAKMHDVAKWVEGATPVTARWNGASLMEIRIGEATP